MAEDRAIRDCIDDVLYNLSDGVGGASFLVAVVVVLDLPLALGGPLGITPDRHSGWMVPWAFLVFLSLFANLIHLFTVGYAWVKLVREWRYKVERLRLCLWAVLVPLLFALVWGLHLWLRNTG